MKNKPRVGMKVYHIRSGGYYEVKFLGMIKVGNAKWDDSVSYQKLGEPNSIVFTRPLNDFNKKFEEV